jgi:hypothetical protein
MLKRTTIRGAAALAAFANYLCPDQSGWDRPEEIIGVTARNGYANRRAVIGFTEELCNQGRRSVFLEDGGTVPLSRARFREPGENPDLPSQEGVFGFGKAAIGLYGIRARMSAPGVLEIANAWGDSVRFGTSSAAAFSDVVWEADQWDLPTSVPPLTISLETVEAFKLQASIFSAAVLSTEGAEREAACAAIRAHWRVCHSRSPVPKVQWFAGPNAALSALAASGSHATGLRKTLQDRALMDFDHEITARSSYQGERAKDQIWRNANEAVGYDIYEGILERIVASRVQPGFEFMGLAASYPRLVWYQFLKHIKVELSEVVSTFCEMTAKVWLLFPTLDYIFAVEPPISVDITGTGCVLLFGDGDRLVIAERYAADEIDNLARLPESSV